MTASLFCKVGPLAGTECQIEEEATVGSEAGNLLVLNVPSVSSTHARIRFDPERGSYRLESLDGRGLALDGGAVLDEVTLQRLHVITFGGEYDFFFRWDGEPPDSMRDAEPSQATAPGVAASGETPGEKTLFRRLRDALSPPTFQPSQEQADGASGPDLPEEALVTLPLEADAVKEETNIELDRGALSPPSFQDSPASASGPGGRSEEKAGAEDEGGFILELETELWSESFPLSEGENVVGRSSECQISVQDATISRRHAILTVEAGHIRVRDLGSMNRSHVAGKEVGEETEVTPDAPLRFGRLRGRIRPK